MNDETLLLRFNGGPQPGTRQAPDGSTWPLPDRLDFPGGAYVKQRESQIPPIEGVARGAEYEWEEAL